MRCKPWSVPDCAACADGALRGVGAMDARLAEFAAQIARQESYQHLTFWLVLVALLVVGALIAVVLYRYAERIADIKAQTDKIPSIEAQLATLNRTIDEVKAEGGQKEWRRRERMTLFRNRLEELLTANYAISEEASRLYGAASGDDRLHRSESADNRLKTIAAFYFPELNVQASNVVALGVKVGATAIRINDQWRTSRLKRAAATTAEEKHAVSKECLEVISVSSAAMRGYHKELMAAVKTLERDAVVLIPQYVP
jgi:hypothetical protein